MLSGLRDRNTRACTWNDPAIFQVTTAQWPWEIEKAALILSEINVQTALEIGSQEGGSLRYWLAVLPSDANMIALDPAADLSGLKDPHQRLYHLKMRSDDEMALSLIRAMSPLDFLFIDGDHSYDGARFDFETYGEMVREGGLIMLHDIETERDDCGVPKLWREIQAAGYWNMELCCARVNGWGGGIGVVIK